MRHMIDGMYICFLFFFRTIFTEFFGHLQKEITMLNRFKKKKQKPSLLFRKEN
jgi:hypothetical protein